MTIGILVMAYGTPSGLDDVEAYYTHIRRGRPPSQELLDELRGRYAAIGGRSPLLEITHQQVAAVGDQLRADGYEDITVALGQKHAAPFIEDGVAELLAAGVDRIVGVVLAPHYSGFSVGEYAERTRKAAEQAQAPPPVAVVSSWHLQPEYLNFLAAALDDAIASLPDTTREEAHVLFTAHSLPERILQGDDPYPTQLRETAEAVARARDLARWSIAWQSAGRTPEPWIGPDVLDAMAEVAAAGAPAVVVSPVGFVADHLEVLYDLDIEAADRARELGIDFARTAAPNADPHLARAVATAVAAVIDQETA
jgi:ferrochelatase